MLKFIDPTERWNVFTHALGVILGIEVSIYFFAQHSSEQPRVLIALGIYCFSLVFLFSASTMYHAISGDIKLTWRKVDHIAILFLIAGTYTPVTLTLLYETSGVWILTGVWSIAAVGFIFKIFFTGRFEILSLIMYLGMGWFILLDAQTVWELFSTNAFIFLILGGSCYTIGVFFYRWKGYKEAHAIWHIWVLAGALSHAFMINEILLIN